MNCGKGYSTNIVKHTPLYKGQFRAQNNLRYSQFPDASWTMRGRGDHEGYDTRRRTDEVENRGCSLPWVDGWSCGDMTPRLTGRKAPREAPIRIHGFVLTDAAPSTANPSSSASRYDPLRFIVRFTECELISRPFPRPTVFLTSSRLHRSPMGHSQPTALCIYIQSQFLIRRI